MCMWNNMDIQMYVLGWSTSYASRLTSWVYELFILSYYIFSFSIMIVHHLYFYCLFTILNTVFNLLFREVFELLWLKFFRDTRFKLVISIRPHKFLRSCILRCNFLSIWFNIWIINWLSMRYKFTFFLNHMNYLFSKFFFDC
jgi:hypothetical protein